jgi:2-polyprenyl-6-methoxyphenol hydroxylase-like FAD-dependent oxidoreductase
MSFFTMPTPASKAGRLEWFVTHQVPGGSFVGIRSDVNPATSKAVIILRGPADPEVQRNPDKQKQLIQERLAPGGWEVPAVLAAMATTEDFYFDELARVTMPTWSKGRIVLLGDAAFCGSPLTGQGTSVAMIGAYILAGEIAAAQDDPRQAIRRYEQLVRPLIAKAQELMPGGVRALTPGGPIEMAISRLINRAVTSKPMRPLMTRLVSTTVKYRVPEYARSSRFPPERAGAGVPHPVP